VREVDEIHDPEHQCQPGRQQEQQQAELQSIQALLDEESHGLRPAADLTKLEKQNGRNVSASAVLDRIGVAYFIEHFV
jgi:hypothetical protein